MPIFLYESKLDRPTSWNIDENTIQQFREIENYPAEILRLKKNMCVFHDVSIGDIMNFFDELARSWTSETPEVLKTFSFLGSAFLLSFLRKRNLLRLARAALRGNPEYMDTFSLMPELGKHVLAQPRGIITHWIAGNVLNLGIISLIQGILTKNANVLKLPANLGLIVPTVFQTISNLEVKTKKNTRISGKDILKTVLFIYCSKEDRESQGKISLESDSRVIWGGEQAVASVMSLPRKIDCEDVVFGPRYSLAVIGKDALGQDNLDNIAFKLAMDASMFEQRACSSPHTVFVETGGPVSPLAFAQALAHGMQKAIKRIPKHKTTAAEAYSIVELRSEHLFSGKVFSSRGTEWTVIYSEDKGLAAPCYSRVVFVRPVSNIEKVIEDIDPSVQTIGVHAESSRKFKFARNVMERGGLRITEIGKMNVYDYPWDGIFPMGRFVRWVSIDQ